MEQKTLGGFLAALRKESGMTQKDLAERLNVSDKTVSRWERNDGAPDLAVIPVLAELFGVSCDELLCGERNAPLEAPQLEEEAPPASAPEIPASPLPFSPATPPKRQSKFWPVLAIVLAAALVVTLLLHFAGSKPEKSLYQQGIELIGLMEEMASNEPYIALYSAAPDLQEILSEAAQGDRSQPKAVYEISVPKGIIAAMAEVSGIEGLSDQLKAHAAARTHGALPSQINAAAGAQVLAAASICTMGKTFVNKDLADNTIYLYTYEDAIPAMVTFTPGEDHTVSASACFLFNQDFVADYVETVEAFFQELGAQVTLVEPY